MPSKEDIEHQQQLLVTYRNNLAHYLQQQALLGKGYIPPGVFNGMRDTRIEIQRVKDILREWGIAVDNEPDDIDSTMSQSPTQRQKWFSPAIVIGGVLVVVVVGIILLLVLRIGTNIVTGNGNVVNSGPGSITINAGDSPEVRAQKAQQAKQLLVNDTVTNMSALDAQLGFAHAALAPLADPLASTRQTVAPASASDAAAGYQQLIPTQQIAALRQSFNSRPLRLEFDQPLVQVLMATGTDPANVRFFYEQLTAADDASESLLTTLESAARGSHDAPSIVYWQHAIQFAQDTMQNRYQAAYITGLSVLRDMGATPDLTAATLTTLQTLEPRQLITPDESDQLLSKIATETTALVERRRQLDIEAQTLRDTDVATYTALNDQVMIKPDDPAEKVAQKAVALRQLGRVDEALAGFDRYRALMSTDSTTPQYVQTARSLTQQSATLGVLGGAYVYTVVDGSAAQAAGFQVGDVIVKYNGITVTSPTDMKLALDTAQSNGSITVEWLRLDANNQWKRFSASVPTGTLGVGMMPI